MAKKATGKPMTKSEVTNALSEATGLSRKEVTKFFDELAGVIAKNLGKSGPGMFSVPGLMKIKVVRKKATEARPGKNPFTGEEIMIKAKPARNVVKVLPLKNLKDMV